MNRRTFLQFVAAGAAGVALSRVPVAPLVAEVPLGTLRRNRQGGVFVRVAHDGSVEAGRMAVFTDDTQVTLLRAAAAGRLAVISATALTPDRAWAQIYGPCRVVCLTPRMLGVIEGLP